MAYANRSDSFTVFCPAIGKDVTYEIISHSNPYNRYASQDLSYHCCDIDECPFNYCHAEYDDGKLILRD